METTPTPAAAPPPPPVLDDTSASFLKDEIERLQSLYLHTEGSAQNVFNFYLTFITAVVGAIVVLVQLGTPTPADALRTRLLVIVLLLFAALVGSVYLSALSGRYGHMARYANAVDVLRRYLIQRQQLTIPALYAALLKSDDRAARPRWALIFPTGTFELFIGTVNSTALAISTYLFVRFDSETVAIAPALIGAILVFIVTALIFNLYSNWVLQRIVANLNVHLDTLGIMPGLAGRQ